MTSTAFNQVELEILDLRRTISYQIHTCSMAYQVKLFPDTEAVTKYQLCRY